MLQTNKLIEIMRMLPYKCNFLFDNRKQYKRDNSLNFQKSIIQGSRKCLNHNDMAADMESYELDI